MRRSIQNRGFFFDRRRAYCRRVHRFKRAKEFNPRSHSFNPLWMTYRKARELASIVFGEEGKDALTARNRKCTLTRLLLKATLMNGNGDWGERPILPPRAISLTKHRARWELENAPHFIKVEHSPFVDEFGFKNFRYCRPPLNLPFYEET
jgi:hypothetical protein